MKKVLVILLAMTVVMAGCGKKKGEDEFVFEYVDDGSSNVTSQDTGDSASNVTESKAPVVGSLDAYVELQYSNEGTIEIPYEDTDSYTVEFSYNIPKINGTSEDAKAINEEIYESAKASIDLVESILDGSAGEIYEPEYGNISYEAYLNGEILSLVVERDSSYTDWVDYSIYNYNVSTMTLMGTQEVLDAIGVSKDEFLSNAKKSFGALALPDITDFINGTDEEVDEIVESEEWKYSIVADYLADYVKTVSDKRINMDLPVYIDGDGALCAIGLVSVPAGAGQYYNKVKIENVSNDAMLKQYCEYAETCHYDGFEKELLGLFAEDGLQASIVRKISLSKMSSEDVYFGFDSNDVTVFTMQFYGTDYSDVYLGTLKFDSMDENGIIFAYELTSKNGEALEGEETSLSGRFYMNPYDYFDKDNGETVFGAIYKFVDGEDMLASDGYNVDFKITHG